MLLIARRRLQRIGLKQNRLNEEGSALERLSAHYPPPRRLSQIFEDLVHNAQGTAITVDQLRNALGERSFATFLVFFALLNMLPLPPGSTLVLGIPLLLISIQMVLGRSTVWLPHSILTKSVGVEQFRQMSEKLGPKVKRVERLIRPRYWPFAPGQADRAVGLCALFLGVLITLPIPFGNWFPALACALLGLALSECDGLLLGIAVAVGLFSLVIVGVIFGSAGALAAFFIL